MRTKKGNTRARLIDVVSNILNLNPELKDNVVGYLAENANAIDEFCTLEKRGSVSIEKCIERIEHHREQIVDALTTIYNVHTNALNPKERTSPVIAAKRNMLKELPHKALYMYAEQIGVDLSDIILPDDTDKLVEMCLSHQREAVNA